jgi:hypothetical protein
MENMVANKHTEGPWNIAPKTCEYIANPDAEIKAKMILMGIPLSFNALSIGTDMGSVALIPLDESSRENAQLIVAAPDLLKALELIHDHARLYISQYGPNQNVFEAVTAAINKAKRHYSMSNSTMIHFQNRDNIKRVVGWRSKGQPSGYFAATVYSADDDGSEVVHAIFLNKKRPIAVMQAKSLVRYIKQLQLRARAKKANQST